MARSKQSRSASTGATSSDAGGQAFLKSDHGDEISHAERPGKLRHQQDARPRRRR
jgi:hypothetical protein